MPMEALTPDDVRQIAQEGLTPQQVIDQIALFEQGAFHVHLQRPCTVDDGIVSIASQDYPALIRRHDAAMRAGRLSKFVPASGAASRMFKKWFTWLDAAGPGEAEASRFAASLADYAFFPDLQKTLAARGTVEDLVLSGRHDVILAAILKSPGLDYGSLPKALLKFHAYPDGNRTALEEHLVEGAATVADGEGRCRIHLTVSAEHQDLVRRHIEEVRARYESVLGVQFCVDLTLQASSTNTVAVDMDNRPIRRDDGGLVFRPGGHGSLLTNLDAIDGDVIFIKNIDNIVPDRLREPTILYKKLLSGHLLALQERIFAYLHALETNGLTGGGLAEAADFCRAALNVRFGRSFGSLPEDEQARILGERLHRPLRVCGMVKNEGEPGGGPFWVGSETGGDSLQIVEEISVDGKEEGQRTLWRQATHFNPVDLVCAVRDYRGRKFDLQNYVNPRAVSITVKSEKGRDVKALELPGLWNGAMAFWNTVFVEVPIETFNPVKVIEDLLRPQHRA